MVQNKVALVETDHEHRMLKELAKKSKSYTDTILAYGTLIYEIRL